jgi:hypothetical protein
MWKERVVPQFKILLRDLPEKTEEKLGQYSQYPGQDSNLFPSGYKR